MQRAIHNGHTLHKLVRQTISVLHCEVYRLTSTICTQSILYTDSDWLQRQAEIQIGALQDELHTQDLKSTQSGCIAGLTQQPFTKKQQPGGAGDSTKLYPSPVA